MPTCKPRVTVTLEPDAYRVLVDMAELGRVSPGRVLSDMVAPVLPALEQLVEASRKFARWHESMKDQLSEVQGEVVADVRAAVEALEARMRVSGDHLAGTVAALPPAPPDGAVRPSAGDSAGGPARASTLRSVRAGPKAARGTGKPPSSNTGVRISRSEENQGVARGGGLPKMGRQTIPNKVG